MQAQERQASHARADRVSIAPPAAPSPHCPSSQDIHSADDRFNHDELADSDRDARDAVA